MTRMCIYDDDIEFSLLFEKLLYRYAEENDKEIDVEIFQGGENAAFQIAQNEYDILFLDIDLGDVKGFEIGKQIRDELKNNKIQIVYISGDTSYAMELFKTRPSDSIKIVQNKDAMYTQIMYDKKDDMKEEAQSWQKVRNMISSLRRTQSGIVWIIRNSHSRKRLKIWESVILRSKHGSGQPRNMKAVCQQEDPAIIPVMRQKRSLVSNES